MTTLPYVPVIVAPTLAARPFTALTILIAPVSTSVSFVSTLPLAVGSPARGVLPPFATPLSITGSAVLLMALSSTPTHPLSAVPSGAALNQSQPRRTICPEPNGRTATTDCVPVPNTLSEPTGSELTVSALVALRLGMDVASSENVVPVAAVVSGADAGAVVVVVVKPKISF